MARSSLRVLENFRDAVEQALQGKNLTRQELARKLSTTRQPVEVVDIYTEVNILEEIIGQQWREITDFVQAFDPESDDFNRLGLGRIRQKRVPGLLAVEQHLKLMVLGKPGSGKTTFLKYVATQCNKGEFQADKIPKIASHVSPQVREEIEAMFLLPSAEIDKFRSG